MFFRTKVKKTKKEAEKPRRKTTQNCIHQRAAREITERVRSKSVPDGTETSRTVKRSTVNRVANQNLVPKQKG